MKAQEKDETYFQQWYQEHGRKLNKDRKQRYKEDPEYRAKVLEQNREARKRRRETQLQERMKEDAVRKTRVERSWKTRPMTVRLDDGETATVNGFTIGAVARMLGCSVQAVRLWERKGILPETPFYYSKGDRLYTADMIETFREILEQQGRLNPNQVRPRPLRMTVRSVRFSDGKVREVELFRIGELATAAQRTVVTLEQLEQRGMLPQTPFRASKLGYRLYTEDMIRTVKEAFQKRAWEIRGDEEWKRFRAEVHQAWSEQGVIGAKILNSPKSPLPKKKPTKR